MNIGGGNPKLSSNLKHSKASLKKLYKSRLTYKKSWEEKYFLYVLINIGENHRGGGETLLKGGKSQGSLPLYQTLIARVVKPRIPLSYSKRSCKIHARLIEGRCWCGARCW